jgi:hypothetical protein
MQQQFTKPVLNGKTFADVVGDPLMFKNPKVAPILLKYVYDLLNYIEPRIKKYIRPEEQPNWLGAINKLKGQYRAAVQFTSGSQGVAEARMSVAVRMQRAADKQRAKSDASLRRTPSSIPKKEEPKQIPVSENIENIMDSLINKIIVNEAVSNYKR